MKSAFLSVLLVASSTLLGCGTHNNPCVTELALEVGPGSGTANHVAASPGNQVQFDGYTAESIVSGSGCAIPNIVERVNATWTSSDTTNVTVSNASGSTNGLATCVGPTAGLVTITGSIAANPSLNQPAQSKTVTLTCQ
jgi:hypothetical protein